MLILRDHLQRMRPTYHTPGLLHPSCAPCTSPSITGPVSCTHHPLLLLPRCKLSSSLHPSSSAPSAPQQTDKLTAPIRCIPCPAAIKVTALGPPALLETASNSLLQIRSLFRRFDAGALCSMPGCGPLLAAVVTFNHRLNDVGRCWGRLLVGVRPTMLALHPPTITWSVPCASTQSRDTPNGAVPQPLCADGNGTITKDEFEQAYREMFVDEPDWVGRGFGQAGLRSASPSHRSALPAALPSLLPHTAWLLRPPPPQAFSHLDVNKRGLVDYVSWQVELQHIGAAALWNCNMLDSSRAVIAAAGQRKMPPPMHDGAGAWYLNGQWCGFCRDGSALCSASAHVCLAPHSSRISRVSVMDTAAIASRCRSRGPFAGEAVWLWMDCCEPSIGG